jgi:transposase
MHDHINNNTLLHNSYFRFCHHTTRGTVHKLTFLSRPHSRQTESRDTGLPVKTLLSVNVGSLAHRVSLSRTASKGRSISRQLHAAQQISENGHTIYRKSMSVRSQILLHNSLNCKDDGMTVHLGRQDSY